MKLDYQLSSPVGLTQVISDWGSAHEHEVGVPVGTAHFAEHMFFKSTLERSSTELKRKICELGTCNGYTGKSGTAYYISTLLGRLPEATSLLEEMIQRPALLAEEIEKERGVILQELVQAEGDPISYFFRTWFADFTGATGHEVLGTRESLSEINRESLDKWRKTAFSDLLWIVVGEAGEINWRDKSAVHGGELAISRAYGEKIVIKHASDQFAVCLVGSPYRVAGETVKDHLVSKVLTSYLGGDMHSVLWKEIRDGAGMAYSTACANWGLVSDYIPFVYALCSNENREECSKKMLTEIDKISQGDVDTDVFRVSLGNVKFNMADSFTSPEDIVDTHIFENWTRGRAVVEPGEIDVSIEDMIKACQHHFCGHVRYDLIGGSRD